MTDRINKQRNNQNYNNNFVLSKSNPANNTKIVTEVNDNISITYNNLQQKELISMRDSSFRNFSTMNNENEIMERVNFLKTIVDKAPKLNLEVIIKLI